MGFLVGGRGKDPSLDAVKGSAPEVQGSDGEGWQFRCHDWIRRKLVSAFKFTSKRWCEDYSRLSFPSVRTSPPFYHKYPSLLPIRVPIRTKSPQQTGFFMCICTRCQISSSVHLPSFAPPMILYTLPPSNSTPSLRKHKMIK